MTEGNFSNSDAPISGFAVPVHRALTEPILLGGAPRAVAILNGTLAAALGLGLRLWLAGLLLAAVGASRRGVGGQARPAIRRRRAPPSAYLQPFERLKRDDEPQGIPAFDHAPCGLLAVGCSGRRGHRPQQGWFLSKDREVSGAGSGFRRAGRTRWRRREIEQRPASARLRLGRLCRGAAQSRQQLSRRPFPGRRLRARRCRAPGRI